MGSIVRLPASTAAPPAIKVARQSDHHRPTPKPGTARHRACDDNVTSSPGATTRSCAGHTGVITATVVGLSTRIGPSEPSRDCWRL